MIRRLGQIWDWIDHRDIDKHAVCWAVFYGLIKITSWAIWYASASQRPGLDVAAVIGAVTAPYTMLMGAVVKYYFEARPTTP